MRIGKVVLNIEYVVDLDNPSMINDAKESIMEDIMNMYKYNDIWDSIELKESPESTEKDITEWLKEL